MEAVERLVATEEIRVLSAKYAMAIDDHDWSLLETLWTEDAVWWIGDVRFEGRDAIVTFLKNCLVDDYYGKHINGQSIIEIADDGQSATGMTDVLWLAQNFEVQVMARYVDLVVRQEGRWLFKEREEVMIAHRPGPVLTGSMAVGPFPASPAS
jgi:uncharacterized protein (TIGR02246 family)